MLPKVSTFPKQFPQQVEIKLDPVENPALTLGVVKEDSEAWEKRVAMVPAIAEKFTKLGYGICMEAGAGVGAGFTDAEYAAKGVKIVERGDVRTADDCIGSQDRGEGRCKTKLNTPLRESRSWRGENQM
jgi:hypothetical protein